MKLTRGKRIALELLGPGLLGAASSGVAGAIIFAAKRGFTADSIQFGLMNLVTWPVVIPFAYVFAAVPSLAYAGIMEGCFASGLKPDSGRAVALSTGLGLASGASMAAAYGFDRPDGRFLWTYFPGIGFAVVLSLGLIIRRLSKPVHQRPTGFAFTADSGAQ